MNIKKFITILLFLMIFNARSVGHTGIIYSDRKNYFPSNNDIQTGEMISKLYKKAIRLDASPAFTKTVYVQTLKNKNYKIFQSWSSKLNTILTSKNLRVLSKICTDNFKKNTENEYHKKFSYVLKINCAQKILELGQNRNISNSKLFINILKNNIEVFLSKRVFKLLLKILKKDNFSQKNKILISNYLTDYYLRTKKPIAADLLKLIIISPKLTDHIQNYGIYNAPENKIVLQNFREKYKLLKKTINNTNQKKFQVFDLYKEFVKFVEENKIYLSSKTAKDYFSFLSKHLLFAGFSSLAIESIKLSIAAADGDDYIDEIFNHIWIYIYQGNFNEAKNKILSYDLINKYKSLPTKIQFWIAYVLNEVKDHELAKVYFKYISQNDPYSFYAIASSTLIEYEKPNKKKRYMASINNPLNESLNSKKIKIKKFKIKNLSKKLSSSFIRLQVWSKIQNNNLLSMETDYLGGFDQLINMQNTNDSFEKYSLKLKSKLIHETLEEISNDNFFLGNFQIIQKYLDENILEFNFNTFQHLFPMPYLKNIKEHTKDFDPLIVLSLIRQESAFNPNAKSRVGAMGLMQLMPSTARQIKRKVSRRQLKNPNINIKIGVAHLKKLFDMYKGNLIYSLAAYNAGEHAVNRWQKKFLNNKNPLINIENIPYSETRLYVKLIFRNIFFYKMLNTGNVQKEYYSSLINNGINYR